MMMPTDLSTQIINALTGINQPGGINILWTTVCTYIMANAEVPFSWAGMSTTTPPTPDPTVAFTAKINTAAGMTLTLPPSMSQAQTAVDALSILSTAINSSMARWTILFPAEQGFLIPPAPVVPLPGVILTPSGATEQRPAMNLLSEQIIAGVKALQIPPNVFLGSHLGIYSGVATYVPLSIF